jgi:hypothetical protein
MTIEDALARIDMKQMPESEMVAFTEALISLAIHHNPDLWTRVAGDRENIDPTIIASFMRSLPEDFGQVSIDG